MKGEQWISVFFLLVCKASLIGCCPQSCSCFGYDGSWITDCSSSDLDSVPVGFDDNTTEIFLQNNKIRKIDNDSFSSLANLQFLHLHENAITTVHESAFADISSSLKYLTLNENEITELSEKVFANMTSLKVLNLNHNKLTNIQEKLFEDLFEVVQLSACDNNLQNIENDILKNSSCLLYAGFSENNLTVIPDRLGESSPDLYTIDYGNNQLKSIPIIPSTLVQVYLIDNEISILERRALENASNLYELFLEYNLIESIEPEAFKNTPNLGWLVLAGNRLVEVNQNMFENLSNLRGLNLTQNIHLNSIPDNSFETLKESLTRLSFDKTNITQLNPEAINVLKNSDLYVWAGSNPWNCDCALQGFSELVSQNSRMFYDLSTMKCVSPEDKNGEGVINVTSDLSVRCSSDTPQSTYNETALIISMSILGGLLLLGGIGYLAYKLKRNNVVDSNDF